MTTKQEVRNKLTDAWKQLKLVQKLAVDRREEHLLEKLADFHAKENEIQPELRR